MAILEKIIHFTIAAINIVVLYFLWPNMKKWESIITDSNSEKVIQNVTFRNYLASGYVIQAFSYVFLLFSGFLPKYRDYATEVFTSIAVPMGLITSTTFWAMYAIDKNVLSPSWLEFTAPRCMNYVLFSFNSISMVVVMLLTKLTFPSWMTAAKNIALSVAVYLFSIFDGRMRYGKFAYKFLDNSTNLELGSYGVLNLVLAVIFYSAAKFVNSKRWGTSISKSQKNKKKKQGNEPAQKKTAASTKQTKKSKNPNLNKKK